MVGRTEVAIVLDKSSSMNSKKTEAISNLNEQIDALQNGPKEVVNNTFVSFIVFNENVSVALRNVPLAEVEHIKEDDYIPCGSTALFDAQAKAIDILKKNNPTPAEDDAFLMITISDGWENASVDYPRVNNKENPVLSGLIEELTDGGQWTFTMLGYTDIQTTQAIMGTLSSGDSFSGCAVGNTISMDQDNYGHTVAVASTSYMTSRSFGATQVNNFYNPNEASQNDNS